MDTIGVDVDQVLGVRHLATLGSLLVQNHLVSDAKRDELVMRIMLLPDEHRATMLTSFQMLGYDYTSDLVDNLYAMLWRAVCTETGGVSLAHLLQCRSTAVDSDVEGDATEATHDVLSRVDHVTEPTQRLVQTVLAVSGVAEASRVIPFLERLDTFVQAVIDGARGVLPLADADGGPVSEEALEEALDELADTLGADFGFAMVAAVTAVCSESSADDDGAGAGVEGEAVGDEDVDM